MVRDRVTVRTKFWIRISARISVSDMARIVVTVSCWFRVFRARVGIKVRSKLTNWSIRVNFSNFATMVLVITMVRLRLQFRNKVQCCIRLKGIVRVRNCFMVSVRREVYILINVMARDTFGYKTYVRVRNRIRFSAGAAVVLFLRLVLELEV